MTSSNNYRFEHKIETLADNAVMEAGKPPSFTAHDLNFSHWEFNHRDGWVGNAWVASANIQAMTFRKAFEDLWHRLSRVIPRISFVSQCYTEYISEPFLAVRDDLNLAFFRYTERTDGVGLMFMEESREALQTLLDTTTIPEEFFYYWNDAVNTIGYSAKLLLMFSAVEALVKRGRKNIDREKREKILGRELRVKLFGGEGATDEGLRNRLVHGEYFAAPDSKINYFEQIHAKVLAYFNQEIFKKQLLTENVVNPQRHVFGNRQALRIFIRPKSANPLELRAVLADIRNRNNDFNFDKYEIVLDEGLGRQFRNE